jgi:hypothetical protein
MTDPSTTSNLDKSPVFSKGTKVIRTDYYHIRNNDMPIEGRNFSLILLQTDSRSHRHNHHNHSDGNAEIAIL